MTIEKMEKTDEDFSLEFKPKRDVMIIKKDGTHAPFNVNKVINFSHVFEGCENLSILNLSNFQTDNAEDFEKTFYGCKKLNVMMSHISIPQKSLK